MLRPTGLISDDVPLTVTDSWSPLSNTPELSRSNRIEPLSPPLTALSCIHQFSASGVGGVAVIVGLYDMNMNTEPVTSAPSPITRSPGIGSCVRQPLCVPQSMSLFVAVRMRIGVVPLM